MYKNFEKIDKKSIKNLKASSKLKNDICRLKDKFWKFGLSSQKKWLKKNVKEEDVHNCIFANKKLVGYTLIRRRKALYQKKTISYYLIDTVTVIQNLRGQQIGKVLMELNTSLSKKNKKISFLLCKKKLIYFYRKCGWKKLKKQKFLVNGKKPRLFGMMYNPNKSKIEKTKSLLNFMIH
tara:strand:- start:406 stop:942 length:537 start_codon:yes stop_codon:yes gene_type:complete